MFKFAYNFLFFPFDNKFQPLLEVNIYTSDWKEKGRKGMKNNKNYEKKVEENK